MKKKKLAKIAVAGVLLAAHLPTDAHAFDSHLTGVLLAVAGCGQHGCQTKPSSNSSYKPQDTAQKNSPSQSQNLPQNNKNINPQVTDAGGDFAVPRTQNTVGGGYSTHSPSSNVRSSSVGSSSPGSFTDSTARGTNVGGSYGIPENRYGSSSEAGSWSGTARPDIGRERVQEYNYNSYNTNRNVETSPSYQGDYLDSSFYSDTVAPYGAPRTEGYDKNYNRDPGYGYEGIVTSGIVTEPQLKSLLSVEGWNVYLQLDPEGKALALQLASQAKFTNKDLAVREAYVRMQERRNYLQKQ